MITVPEATRKIVERSRYLTEAISKGLINYSSLARYIKPELETMLVKKISTASIVMALNRLEKDFQPKYVVSNIFKVAPEIITRSNLHFVTLLNTDVLGLNVLISRETSPRSFFTENRGINETTFVFSQDLFEKYKGSIEQKTSANVISGVSAITIYLPEEALTTSGIYYFFLKSLSWEGVNVLEIISTRNELTLIFEEREVERAFGIIKSLFNK